MHEGRKGVVCDEVWCGRVCHKWVRRDQCIEGVCVCEGGSCACVDGTELNSIAFPRTPIPMDASRPLLTIKYS